MAVFEVVTSDDLHEGDETPGIDRRIAFETDNNVVVQTSADGEAASGWHHHGDRHVYGYLMEGSAVMEYGPGGAEREELEAGDFMHIEPGMVHRDVNPTDERQVWIISFVGSGPLVENVDGPDPA